MNGLKKSPNLSCLKFAEKKKTQQTHKQNPNLLSQVLRQVQESFQSARENRRGLQVPQSRDDGYARVTPPHRPWDGQEGARPLGPPPGERLLGVLERGGFVVGTSPSPQRGADLSPHICLTPQRRGFEIGSFFLSRSSRRQPRTPPPPRPVPGVPGPSPGLAAARPGLAPSPGGPEPQPLRLASLPARCGSRAGELRGSPESCGFFSSSLLIRRQR